MSNGFAEALASLAVRLPRVVREHEVLRVGGFLPGGDVNSTMPLAAKEVLKWATNQAGTRLPNEAWEGESFALDLPGRDPTAIRLRTATADIWAFRLHRPDRDVPGRAWTTEVVIGHLPGQEARFCTRVLVASDEVDISITPAVPSFLRQIVTNCGMVIGSQSIVSRPIEARSRDDADALLEHLTDPGRSLPTFVLTCFNEDSSPPLDADMLSSTLLGLAHIAVAHSEACWALTHRLGKRLSVFGGAVRVYRPGFDANADPYAHPLVLPGTFLTSESVERTTRWLRETAAQASLRRMRQGKDFVTFAAVRAVSLEARQTQLNKTANEREQLAAAFDQVKALQDENNSIRSENEYYVFEYERERQRAEAAEAQLQAATWRIQQLTEKLRESGTDPDGGITLPESWDGFAVWCEQQLAGRLVLAASARRGVRQPLFNSAKTAAAALLWLATAARDRFISGGGPLSNMFVDEGIQNAPCGEDSYDFDWAGRKLNANWHVKSGGNTRDPTRCLRIYYCFDDQTQQIIVSDMPAHRRTGAS